jgi:hypothetical protein
MHIIKMTQGIVGSGGEDNMNLKMVRKGNNKII